MQVIVAPVHKLPVVTVLAVINAGATLDPRGHEGLAQLTAEMLREGTQRLSGVEILDGFENLGSSLEAGADWDSSAVSMTLLESHLKEALELMSEVLMSPSFPEHELERLKAERIAERLQILSEPRALADESFAKALYTADSRYAMPLGGNRVSIEATRREDVEIFFKSRYTPDAVTMIVAGDIEGDRAVEEIREAFGKWRGRQSPGGLVVGRASHDSCSLEIVEKPDAAQAELRIGHVGIPRNHRDYFKVSVMNALLGGLFSSRINLNLRERHGYTYGAASYFDWRRDAGPFVIATAVQSEVSADAVRETLIEINGMRHEAVPLDELSLATNYLEGVFPIRYETTSAIASALANIVVFGLSEDFYDTYRANVHAVTPADVLTAARTHIHPERLQVVVVGNSEIVSAPLEHLGFGPISIRPVTDT